MENQSAVDSQFERLFTIKSAAEAIGLPYFKLQRAVKAGIIPSYTFFNSRRYVKLSDIVRAMSPLSLNDI